MWKLAVDLLAYIPMTNVGRKSSLNIPGGIGDVPGSYYSPRIHLPTEQHIGPHNLEKSGKSPSRPPVAAGGAQYLKFQYPVRSEDMKVAEVEIGFDPVHTLSVPEGWIPTGFVQRCEMAMVEVAYVLVVLDNKIVVHSKEPIYFLVEMSQMMA